MSQTKLPSKEQNDEECVATDDDPSILHQAQCSGQYCRWLNPSLCFAALAMTALGDVSLMITYFPNSISIISTANPTSFQY